MIRFKDAEPAKAKEAARKPGDKARTDEAAAAEAAPPPEFALTDGAKPAASKRKKNFGG
jgi:hypothetical protein